MPPFKDEHILIIAPGSQLTLAQLGLPESFTPATTRLRTRMFPAEDGKSWEPYKINPIKKAGAKTGEDVEMGGTGEAEPNNDADEEEFEEDPESDEGAVYPLTEGRITHMPAFLALLNHVHNILSPTLHTPILLIAQPAWTAQDHETLTQFFFEKFKTPAFCIMDSALAISYGYGVASATIIDVGYHKVDITAVSDFSVLHVGRTIALPKAGGDAMTDRLLELLGPKGWTKDMCEQLKKSPISEILPPGTPLPGAADTQQQVSNPAAMASTGAPASGPSVKISEAPRGPGIDTEVGDEEIDGDGKTIDDEGVLDVASIVASGKTQEFLAAQEKKKAAAALRKAAKDAADAAAAKPIRLPNSKRDKVTFHYQERKPIEEIEVTDTDKHPVTEEGVASQRQTTPEHAVAADKAPQEAGNVTQDASVLTEGNSKVTAESTADPSIPVDDQSAKREQARAAKREEKRKAREGQGDPALTRREIEVGTERFLAASGGILDTIADAIHRTIISVDDMSKRSELWESVIIVGNGSRVRGFKEGLLGTLTSKYLISPSSATIFTSELPSNLSTPVGTGSQTPTKEFSSQQPMGSSVNPLLLAATTASNPGLNPSMSVASSFGGVNSHTHSSHSQTPTSIKIAKIPEYFPEFKNDGFEECVFLGAQVAAKVIFVQDQGVSGGFLSRVQYNDLGPSGIHEIGMTF
ncbi:MAG: Actin-like protein arp9 (SWI/SNF complex component arp9) [Claussenomyces sp. TS43310]|nr:MAG: Actin-like protein arp9 (SWI/SNF complex component arp9) [Claussenomyces sp. TS43310]